MDVGALFKLALPVAVLCGVLQLLLWLSNRRRPEPLMWAASDFIGVIGGALITTRIGPLWLSSTIGNGLIIVSLMLVWAGLRRCVGLAIPLRTFAIVVMLFTLLFYGLWAAGGDLGLRVLTSSMALSIGNAWIAFDLARGGDQSDRRIRGVLSLVFAAHALFFLFRAATAMTLEAEEEFLRTGGLQAFTVLWATLKLLIWNLGAVILLRGDRGSRHNAELS